MSSTAAALLLSAALAAQVAGAQSSRCDTSLSSQTVSLVHVTDLHEHYHPGPDGVSPYARIRGYFNTTLAENPYSLLIGGGDDHEKGSLAGTLSRGAAAREATRALRFDIRVLGNHDFAWGAAAALDHSRDPSGPVLASNLSRLGPADGPGPVDFVRLDIGCLRLGFIGLVGRPWSDKDVPAFGDYPGFRADHDYAKVARRLADTHAKNVDLMILISHLGREEDLRLAAAVPKIRLILSGHTHGLTWEPLRAGKALVIETGKYAEHLSRIDLTFDLAARRLTAARHGVLAVDSDLPVDKAVASQIKDILMRHAPQAHVFAGCACAVSTTSSAAAIAAEAARTSLVAEAALIDLQTVWTPWKAGPLAPQNFLDAFKIERQPPDAPGFNSLVLVEIGGAELGQILTRLDDARWSYSGPKKPDASRRYRLVLTRRAALHPSDFFPVATLKRLKDGPEVWEVLVDRARRRRSEGLCIDDGCVPFQ